MMIITVPKGTLETQEEVVASDRNNAKEQFRSEAFPHILEALFGAFLIAAAAGLFYGLSQRVEDPPPAAAQMRKG